MATKKKPNSNSNTNNSNNTSKTNNAPTVNIVAGFDINKPVGGSVAVTVYFDFSTTVQDFELNDIEVIGGAIKELKYVNNRYQCQFIPKSGFSGLAEIKIAKNKFKIISGTYNNTEAKLAFNVKAAPLTVDIRREQTDVVSIGKTAKIYFDFSEPVNLFDERHVSVSKGMVRNFRKISDKTWEATYFPPSNSRGDSTIIVNQGATVDIYQNSNLSSKELKVFLDTTPFQITINIDARIRSDGDVGFTIMFNRPPVGQITKDMIVVDGGLIKEILTPVKDSEGRWVSKGVLSMKAGESGQKYITINSNVIFDSFGVGNNEVKKLTEVVPPPEVKISFQNSFVSKDLVQTVKLVFSQSSCVDGIDFSSIRASSGQLTDFKKFGACISAVWTPSSDMQGKTGDCIVSINAGAFSNSLGIKSKNTSSASFKYDLAPLTISSSATFYVQKMPDNGVEIIFNASRPINISTLSANDFNVSGGGTIGEISVINETTFKVRVNNSNTSPGGSTVTLLANSVEAQSSANIKNISKVDVQISRINPIRANVTIDKVKILKNQNTILTLEVIADHAFEVQPRYATYKDSAPLMSAENLFDWDRKFGYFEAPVIAGSNKWQYKWIPHNDTEGNVSITEQFYIKDAISGEKLILNSSKNFEQKVKAASVVEFKAGSENLNLKSDSFATVSLAFSEKITRDLTSDDFVVAGGSIESIRKEADNLSAYTVMFRPKVNYTGSGSIALKTSAIYDSDGNIVEGAGKISFNIDTVMPTGRIIIPTKKVFGIGEFDVKIEFSEAVLRPPLSSIETIGGSLSESASSDNTTFNYKFLPYKDWSGVASIKLLKKDVIDLNGNSLLTDRLETSFNLKASLPHIIESTFSNAFSKGAAYSGQRVGVQFVLEGGDSIDFNKITANAGIFINWATRDIGGGLFRLTCDYIVPDNYIGDIEVNFAAGSLKDIAGNVSQNFKTKIMSGTSCLSVNSLHPEVSNIHVVSQDFGAGYVVANIDIRYAFDLLINNKSFLLDGGKLEKVDLISKTGSGATFQALIKVDNPEVNELVITILPDAVVNGFGNANVKKQRYILPVDFLAPKVNLSVLEPVQVEDKNSIVYTKGGTKNILLNFSEITSAADYSSALNIVNLDNPTSGALPAYSVKNVSNTQVEYLFSLANEGRFLVTTRPGVFADKYGNKAGVSNSLLIYNDLTTPEITICANKTHLKAGEATNFDIFCSEQLNNFDINSLDYAGGRIVAFKQIDLLHYSGIFVSSDNAQNCFIAVKDFKDLAGNANNKSNTVKFTKIMRIEDAYLATPSTPLTANSERLFFFDFSEDPGDSFSSGDISLSGGQVISIYGAGKRRKVLVKLDPVGITGGKLDISVGAFLYSNKDYSYKNVESYSNSWYVKTDDFSGQLPDAVNYIIGGVNELLATLEKYEQILAFQNEHFEEFKKSELFSDYEQLFQTLGVPENKITLDKIYSASNPYGENVFADRFLDGFYRYLSLNFQEQFKPEWDYLTFRAAGAYYFEKTYNSVSQYKWTLSAFQALGNLLSNYNYTDDTKTMQQIALVRSVLASAVRTIFYLSNGVRWSNYFNPNDPLSSEYSAQVARARSLIGVVGLSIFALSSAVNLGANANYFSLALKNGITEDEKRNLAIGLAVNATSLLTTAAKTLAAYGAYANWSPQRKRFFSIASGVLGLINAGINFAGYISRAFSSGVTKEQRTLLLIEAFTIPMLGIADGIGTLYMANAIWKGNLKGSITWARFSGILNVLASLSPTEIYNLVKRTEYNEQVKVLGDEMLKYGYKGDLELYRILNKGVNVDIGLLAGNVGIALIGIAVEEAVLKGLSTFSNLPNALIMGLSALLGGIRQSLIENIANDVRNKIKHDGGSYSYFDAGTKALWLRMLNENGTTEYLSKYQEMYDVDIVYGAATIAMSNSQMDLAAITRYSDAIHSLNTYIDGFKKGIRQFDRSVVLDTENGVIDLGDGKVGLKQALTFLTPLQVPGKEDRTRESVGKNNYYTKCFVENKFGGWKISDGDSSTIFDIQNVVYLFRDRDDNLHTLKTSIFGGAGDDFVLGNLGSNFYDGGAGANTISYSSLKDVKISISGVDGGFNVFKTASRAELWQETIDSRKTTYGKRTETVEYRSFEKVIVANYTAQDVAVNVKNIFTGDMDDEIRLGTGGYKVATNGGDDIVVTGSGDDVVDAGDGSDYVDTGEGNDTVFSDTRYSNTYFGGDGVDSIVFTDNDFTSIEMDLANGSITKVVGSDSKIINEKAFGFENVVTSGGNDIIKASEDANQIYSGSGNDIVYGRGGNDLINGGSGNDCLFGDEGDDVFVYGVAFGNDIVDGGNGYDGLDLSTIQNTGYLYIDLVNGFAYGNKLSFAEEGISLSSIEWVHGGQEGNSILGSYDNNVLIGGGGNDYIDGGAGNDAIYGAGGDDDLKGGEGDDKFAQMFGSATVDGGSGVDTIDYSIGTEFVDIGSIGNVNVNLELGLVYKSISGSSIQKVDVIKNVENVSGTERSDVLKGDLNDNVLVGYGGDDVIYGGNGNDTLDGGSGVNVLFGEEGDDTFVIRSGGNNISGGAGRNRLDFSSISQYGIFVQFNLGKAMHNFDSIDQTWSNDNVDSFSVIQVVDGSQKGDLLSAFLFEDSVALFGNDGDDNIFGGEDNDMLLGDAGDDKIHGGGGNDTISGGSGFDQLEGDAGDDYFVGDFYRQFDIINGGDGFDIVNYDQESSAGSDLIDIDFAPGAFNICSDFNFNVPLSEPSGIKWIDKGDNVLGGIYGSKSEFLAFNVSSQTESYVWGQSVSINSGTNYRFSANVFGQTGVKYTLCMDGSPLLDASSGGNVAFDGVSGWKNWVVDFSSGLSSMHVLSIQVETSGGVYGGIDDIILAETENSLYVDISAGKITKNIGGSLVSDSISSIEGVVGSKGDDIFVGDTNDNYFGGSIGNDAYFFKNKFGSDVVDDLHGSNQLIFDVDYRSIWLENFGGDLRITDLKGNGSVTVKRYFCNEFESELDKSNLLIKSGDKRTLAGYDINKLVQSMSSFGNIPQTTEYTDVSIMAAAKSLWSA